jgi:hypothetical protein
MDWKIRFGAVVVQGHSLEVGMVLAELDIVGVRDRQ